MATFYKSYLLGCETYEDFKDNIDEFNYATWDGETGDFYNVSEYSKVFKGFVESQVYINFVSGHCDFLRSVCHYNLLAFTSPEFNAKNKTVTFFESEEKREKGVRSNPTKMGKFFRKIAPYFNDKQIEFLVNYTVDYYTESVYEHKIARGDEISEIYLFRAEGGRNVGDYSCINASCMRYDDWPIHPTKVYATESWELHYLTNEEGEIGARALVCKDDGAYSYIYASCEHAGNILREKLEDLGFINCEEVDKAFDGAKLLKIEHNGSLVAPYIDYHCEVKDCGDYLRITYSYPDYSFCNTSGYVDIEVIYECNSCGEETHGDYVITVDGETYCVNCTFFCDHFNEHVAGEPVFVYYSNYGHYDVCEDALESMSAVYNEDCDEWQTPEWYEEYTKEDEEDSDDENEPKKEIVPGVKCVVISGYQTSHLFPLGTVVEVVKWTREGVWDCKNSSGLYQIVAAKDLVVVE